LTVDWNLNSNDPKYFDRSHYFSGLTEFPVTGEFLEILVEKKTWAFY
jgi:hypothetical protein